MAEDVLAILCSVRDPRDVTARHDLGEMLFLALCGLLCGEKTCVDLADFAAGHEAAFRMVLRLRQARRQPIPHRSRPTVRQGDPGS